MPVNDAGLTVLSISALRHLYTLILYLLLPFVLVRLWWRGRQTPAYRQRVAERFGRLPAGVPRNAVWIHAVSVGESQATQPMVTWLKEAYPDLSLVMTTTTPTGGMRVHQLYGDSVHHLYFPYDLPCVLKSYLNQLMPRVLLIMETEVWPNLLRECHDRGLPVALINARLSAASWRSYTRWSAFAREAFGNFDLIVTQSTMDAKRFSNLGVSGTALKVCGSIKFDITIPASIQEQGDLLRAELGADRSVWIAASTHGGEEKIILKAHTQILKRYPDALLILVPRHPERFERVADLIESAGLVYKRRTENQPCTEQAQVFLGDVMGELPVFYGAADVAFVGGSLVSTGGHNILEPAALGIPVLVGPYMQNFVETTQLMLESGGALRTSADKLADDVTALFGDPVRRTRIGQTAHSVVVQNQGAMDCTAKAIDRLLSVDT